MQRVLIDNQTKSSIDDWIDRVIGQIRVEMHNNNLNASGNLSRSLEGVVGDDEIKILADPYFLYAEKGRDKGKVPRNFIDILQQWANDKRVGYPNDQKKQRTFAFFIMRKIKKFGSYKWRNPSARQDVVGGVLNKELPELNKIVENRIVLYINDNLF